MSWLRLDDSFADHPKLLELAPAERWSWLEVLLYCARHRTGGEVQGGTLRRLRVPARLVARWVELELLEDVEGELHVHDWAEYNGALEAAADRQKRYRMRQAGVAEAEVLERAPPRSGAGLSADRDVTVTSRVTSRAASRETASRARGIPNPIDQDQELPPTSSVDVARARGSSSPAGGRVEDNLLEPGKELAVARLLALLELDEARSDYVRGACGRLPESVPVGLLERLSAAGGAPVRDRVAYVLGSLRTELERRGLR